MTLTFEHDINMVKLNIYSIGHAVLNYCPDTDSHTHTHTHTHTYRHTHTHARTHALYVGSG